MKNFVIFPNYTKEKTVEFADEIVKYLSKINCNAQIMTEDAKSDEIIDKKIDFAIVLGGDGSILRTIKRLKRFDIPILGINMGHLGYLAEVETSETFDAIEKLILGEYRIEKRILLRGTLNDKSAFKSFNEIAVHRDAMSKMLKLGVYINDNYIESFCADGVLVATPTGSTAYNLSAGGPILTPDSENMIITPICPHSFMPSAIVVSGLDRVRIVVEEFRACENDGLPAIIVDGLEKEIIHQMDKIDIELDEHKINIVKIKNESFYDVLCKKLR